MLRNKNLMPDEEPDLGSGPNTPGTAMSNDARRFDRTVPTLILANDYLFIAIYIERMV